MLRFARNDGARRYFAATTGAVRNHHFDAVEEAFLGDERVRGFMAEHNAPALRETAARLQEAIDRGLWTPRSNSARMRVADAMQTRERADS